MNILRQTISDKISMGGGITMEKHASIFKPLVATSLALALGVSVASATDCDGSASAICWKQGVGETGFQKFTTLKIEAERNSQFNKIQFVQLPSGSLTIDNFTLKFRNSGGSQQQGAEASIGGGNAQIKLINKNNGLQLGNAGTSTLFIDFDLIRWGSARTATLVFDGTTPNTAGSDTPKTALKGNIEVKASQLNDIVNATFKGDMIGNIDINARKEGGIIYQRVKTNFTFDSGAKLKGNLTALYTNGEQNFIFQNGAGGIEGNITASGGIVVGNGSYGYSSENNTRVNITFKNHSNSTNFIKGNGSTGQIIAEGSGGGQNAQYKYNAHNRILFENKGEIGESSNRVSIIARPREAEHDKSRKFGGAQSYNLIQFKKQATLYLENLQAMFANQYYATSDYRNILSLELNNSQRAGDTNTLSINVVEANVNGTGGNYIGKGFLTLGSSGTAKDLTINTNAIDTPSVSNIAKGKLTANKIISKNGGKNTILIEEIAVDNGIFAGDNAKNTIFIGQGNSTIGTNGIDNQGNGSSGDYAIVTGASGENIFTLDSANLTIAKNIYTASGRNTTFNLNGTNSTLTLQGATNTITKLTANATESTLNLTNGTATITTTEIGNGSTLNLQAPKITTETLKLSANATSATLNLSSNAQATLGQAHNFNLLEIGKTNQADSQSVGLSSSNLTFVVSVDTEATQAGSKIGGVDVGASGGTYGHAYSDRVVILSVGNNNQGNTALKEQIAVAIDPSQTSSIKYSSGGTETEHNIAVATIKNRDNSDNVNNALATFTSIETINGGEKILIDFEKVATNENGKVDGVNGKVDGVNGKAQAGGGYTTYFLGKAISLGVDNTTQQALTSALSINYDLYIANLNSLNKRMGELRDNPYTQGVWARVFGGLQESNFGLGARTSYVTAQGGYDYALETEGAKNYIGLAFSYMHSKGESNKATQASNAINVSGINTIYLSNIQSSGYEIALYHSYVSNVGLYNDTIAKLSYITSDFSLSNSSDHNNTANNLGFTLSNEVGYRFILGEQQDYFIDPQLELSLGYLNQSDFTTKMKTRSGKGNQLKALQESVFLTRTRLGASFGKKIVEQDKNISLYVGTFYEYDLVTGGSNKLTTSTTKAYNPEFASNGRVVLNVGSNLELNQSTRVYVDVEKSFGDKLRTQLQFNLGARYSFGEKTSIENAKAQTTAPLRVGNTPTEETEKDRIVPTKPNKAKDTGTKATNQ
ncbi:hypothetical protein BBW65_00340 [Helicobacter enhydrae]|uniref:Autotransporter domain-containing protein n=1 Tax=Helicobacter enhydrae TaxID=222136 RepID=A0A1B1U3Q4_9HELI|nr:autotransporter outer membrane beta-barrel domain-containing protein [Helicobacter enhydrae]ANV97362.1 hypothetical protein BBW65_00340 [Helicobacter enhydrae]